MAAAPSAQARVTLQDAFERFASTVAPDDKRRFHNTQLKDVRDEAIRIERQLRARRTQRCMARLDNFLRGMEHYSKVVEVLCNGTPFLPWIWAPVKLMLMITADSISAFEKLIEAYGKIGDIVSRLDRLGDALVNDHNFQNVLALVYSDIVEFHRRAYKFVKRKSWSIFFSSMWAGFESRFNGILKNLAYHTELADKEAAAADIAESVRRSKVDDENWEQQEREWTAVKIQKVLAWLGTTDNLPADLLDRHLRDYLPHSCDWFIQHKATESWLGDSAKNPLLWLCGKPGAGKSMICSALVQHTETNAVHVFYYFCSFLGSRSDGPSRLLRSLISQVIQKHQDLAIYVHDVYFKTNPEPTKKALLTLLPELLRGLGSVRLIVDGIDEWASRDQKELLNDLSQMISTDQSSHICKIMVANRDTMATSRRKKDKLSTMISLSNGDEGLAITRAIASFVDDKLADLPEHFEELDPDSSIMAHVKKTLLEKSQGMFLWVSLVLQSLDTVYSPEELRTIVDNLPSDLEALYKQIVTRLCSAPGAQSYGGVPRIMSWICFSRRPLHKAELLQALSMFPDDIGSQMRSIPVASILDHCKPLIEELPDSTIVPVHFSVREYFLKAPIPQIVPAIDVALDISCACAIVIMRGLELVRLGSNSTDYLALIASGNCRLLPYATEFWIEHCLQYASGRDLRPGRPFQRQLDRLHGTHEAYLHALGLATTHNVSSDWANATHAEERLSLFLNIPIYGLMANVLGLRQLVSQFDGDNGSNIEIYVINNDRTLFSRLAYTYESAVVHLLAQKEVQGIPPATLRSFQESYASTAFRCRFPHCERLSSGFATSQLRLEHETIHFQRVYCQTVSCQFHRIGFGKKSALNAHTKKHHGQSNVLLIPAKVRHVMDAKSKSEEHQQNSQGSDMPLWKQDSVDSAERLLRMNRRVVLSINEKRFHSGVLPPLARRNLPPSVLTWAQLKTWVVQNPTLAPEVDIQRLELLQAIDYQDRERELQHLENASKAPRVMHTDFFSTEPILSTEPKNTLENPFLTSHRRGSPLQNSFEGDQHAPLSGIPVDGSTDGNPFAFDLDVTSRPEPAALENFDFNNLLLPGEVDFDSFLNADNNYGSDDSPATLKPHSPATNGDSSTRPPVVNNADFELSPQEQLLPYGQQLMLLEEKNEKRLLITRQWQEKQKHGYPYKEQLELRNPQEGSHHSPIAPGGAPPILQPVSSDSGTRSQGQQIYDAAAAFQSPLTESWVDVNNAPANASLTQAQKHQLYSEQLLRLEKQNHERLRRKHEHQQQQTSQEHALHRQQSVQQQRAAQQAVNDSENRIRVTGEAGTGLFHGPNRRSSPFTIQSMLHPPQPPPDQSRSSVSPSNQEFPYPFPTPSLASRPDSATASPRQRPTLDLARLQMQESSPPVPSWRNHLPYPSFGQDTAISSPPSPSDRLLPTSTPQGSPWGQRQSSTGNGDTAPNMFTFGSTSPDDYYDKLELELDEPVEEREQQPSFAEVHRRARALPLPVDDPSADADLRKSRGPIFSARGRGHNYQ